MEARKTELVLFLDGTNQFSIPIYQRPYSWKEQECMQLWEDIEKVAQNDNITSHFIGSIVYIDDGLCPVTGVPKRMVIDGQQRLTTISLLLAALGEIFEENGNKNTKTKINNKYLFNNDEQGEERYKLLLQQHDYDTFKNIINGTEIPKDHSYNIANNFKFFQEQFRKKNVDFNLIYKGISKLAIVDISLDNNHDNPQVIFESLNSTGKDLSQADLIRNYVLMNLDRENQERLYMNFWLPMEKSFGDSISTHFDRFMRDYLTMKTGKIPNKREVYSAFKIYYASSSGTKDDIISDVHRFSKFFTKLAFEQEENTQLSRIIRDINMLEVNVAYPFLLEVLDDHNKKLITLHDLLEIFLMVESYVVRRAICEVPTKSLNKTFANLADKIDKENAYLESIQAAFNLKTSYQRFPNDSEFYTEFLTKNVYDLKIKKYLFDKLENHDRKERVNVDEYTFEHIMPQNENLSEEWQKELGSEWKHIRDKYLHTIGNLTLTGYNSELSDKTFLEKRDMDGGFTNSPISLNTSLKKLEHWNESEIINRANSIIELAKDIWKFPELSQNVLERYKNPEDDKDDVLDDDDDDAPKWHAIVKSASNDVRKNLDELILKIKEKFDCEVEAKRSYLFFYVRRPFERKSCFAILTCGKNTANVCFRIDPASFNEDEYINRVNGWFFTRGTERRIKIKSEHIPNICRHLEHSYDATNSLLQTIKIGSK
ncbi:MAG: DUF262 and DUF1524 domain-containing protein [Thaumarchaeota archaeon]|nr:DUF262 and DUF1524 domain-containing protein [Nitrososphaerota archaeon]